MMSLPSSILQQLIFDVKGHRIQISPNIRATCASAGLLLDDPDCLDAEIEVIHASAVCELGRIAADTPAETRDGLKCFVCLPDVACLVKDLEPGVWRQATRVFTPLAVFDVVASQLVVTELAPGASVRDLQATCGAQLWVASGLSEVGVLDDVNNS